MSSLPLAGKIAIVTGGSRGIGRAIALRLARDGAAVSITYHSSHDSAHLVCDEISKVGSEALALRVDMADLDGVRELFRRTDQRFGGIDILVNNAGTAWFAPIGDVSEDRYDELFDVNTKGVFFAIQEAARKLRDGGRIVNISSGITILGGGGAAVYAGSKAAVEQFTLSAAKELGHRGITVNTVSAGMTRTDLLKKVVPADIQQNMADGAPFGRLGEPEDIADVVAFLASSDGRWITGQNIRATGGMS